MSGEHSGPFMLRMADPSSAAIYARAPNPRDQGLQLAACLRYAEQVRLIVAEHHTYVEEMSAGDHWSDRPALAELQGAMLRGEFATLLLTTTEVLFHSDTDFDNFARLLPNYGVSLVVVSASRTPAMPQTPKSDISSLGSHSPLPETRSEPASDAADEPLGDISRQASGATSGDLSQLGSLARDWMITNLAHGDEQAYDHAADAVRRTARDVAVAAAATLGSLLPQKAPNDSRALHLGAAAHPSNRAPSMNESGAVPGDVPHDSASPAGGLRSSPAPSPVAPNLVPHLQHQPHAVVHVAHALVADHSAVLLERQRRAQDGSHLDAAAGKRVGMLVTAVQAVLSRIRTYFTVAAEMLRFPVGGYGPGDIIAAVEGFAGRTLDGLSLSKLERVAYVTIAALPYVPSRIVVGGYRRIEPWVRGADTLTGWAFMMSQLPPWLRNAIPDPNDPRYPRSPSFRIVRAFGGLSWLPFLLYFSVVTTHAITLVAGSQHHFGVLLDAAELTRILLLNALIPSAAGQLAAVAVVLGAGLLGFLAALVIGQATQIDRLRGALAVQMRDKLPKAHAMTAHRVHTTLSQEDLTLGEKAMLSLQHVHDMSLQTAKSIVGPVLISEGVRFVVSVLLLIGVVIAGIVLVFLGLV